MLGLFLLFGGLLLLSVPLVFPHENTYLLRDRLLRLLANERIQEKYRIDLPKMISFYWRCTIELKRIPMALNEMNEIILYVWPWHGDRLSADVEIPIESTDDLKEVLIKITSPSFDFKDIDEMLPLNIGMNAKGNYIVTPKVPGKGQIRFEFWQKGSLRGYKQKSFDVKSRQYGIILPASVTVVITAIGALLSMLGALLSVLGFFR